MKTRMVFLLLLGLWLVSAIAAAGRDMVREAEIEQRLQQLDPSLVEPFRAARVALDKDDYLEAERLLRRVCDEVPSFDPALRRLGTVLARKGNTLEGRAFAEKAVVIERSAANLGCLAYVLLAGDNGKVSDEQQERALSLLLECRSLPDGQDEYILSMTAQAAFQLNKLSEARAAVAGLQSRYPELMQTHYYAAYVAAMDEHWIRAESEMRKAQKLGANSEAVRRFLDSGIQTRATGWRIAGGTGLAIGVWAVGLVSLFGIGAGLSQTTLRQIERSDATVPVTPSEQRLRRVYRSVVNVAGLYYYVSLPVVLVLVIAAAAAIILGFLMLGFLPIKLALVLVIGALITVWTMGRSLLLRVKNTDAGRPLERGEAEGLWKLTDEVAKTLDTRPIDEIRITVGTELCVYERGTWRDKLHNRAMRVLVIGAAVLDGFKQDDFRCVLAHEYGHFSHRDTAGGDIAMRVQNDMLKFYFAMRDAGQATWLNVAFHFLRLYHFLFRRIAHGATRLQEVLADRVAAQHYGAKAFEGGLRHVIRQSIIFESRADCEINDAIKAKRPLQNLYGVTASANASIEENFQKALTRPTTADDTHPSPMDRFRLVGRIPAPSRATYTGAVWDLFRDRDAIVREMMATVEKNIAPHRA